MIDRPYSCEDCDKDILYTSIEVIQYSNVGFFMEVKEEKKNFFVLGKSHIGADLRKKRKVQKVLHFWSGEKS